MTTTDPHRQPTEVLDLYDVLPPADAQSDGGVEKVTSMIRGVGRNLAAILGMFAVALSAFVLCTVLFGTGVGLAVLFVGLFILVGGFAADWDRRGADCNQLWD